MQVTECVHIWSESIYLFLKEIFIWACLFRTNRKVSPKGSYSVLILLSSGESSGDNSLRNKSQSKFYMSQYALSIGLNFGKVVLKEVIII